MQSSPKQASAELFSSDEFRVYCFKVCLGAAKVVSAMYKLPDAVGGRSWRSRFC